MSVECPWLLATHSKRTSQYALNLPATTLQAKNAPLARALLGPCNYPSNPDCATSPILNSIVRESPDDSLLAGEVGEHQGGLFS
jgi:hypothetical protein